MAAGFKIADGYIDVHAEVDRGELQRTIQAGVASISRAARTINLLVDIDVADLARKIQTAIRSIPAAARTITINVDVDMGAALARLAALQGILGAGGAGGGGVAGGVTSLTSALSGFATVLGVAALAATGFIATFTVLPPLIGLVIASVGGLTAAGFGMIGVAGALALGLRGMSDALKEAATTGKVSAEALKNLTPAARSFVLALTPVHGLLQSFSRIAQQNLFAGLDKVLTGTLRNLGVLGPHIGEIATGLGSIASYLLTAIGATRNVEMLATIFSFMGDTLNKLALAIPNIVNALLRIGESAAPILTRVADKVVELSAAFQAWIVGLDRGGLDNIFTVALREAKGLVDLFGGLIIVSAKFLAAFFPGVEAGTATLTGLVRKLDEISAWLDDPANREMLRSWVDTITNGIRTVFDVAGTVVNAIGTVVTYVTSNRDVLLGVFAVIGTAAAAAAGIWAAGWIAAAAATIAATWPVWLAVAAVAALTAAVVFAYHNWDTFREAVDGAVSWLRDNLPGILESVRGHLAEVASVLQPLVSYIQANSEAFANLGKVLLVGAGIIIGVVVVAVGALVSVSATLTAALGVLALAAAATVAAVYNLAQTLWDAFNNTRDFLGGVVDAIENFVGAIPGALGAAVEAVEGFFATVWATVSAWPEQLGGVIDTVEAAVAGFVSSVITWFTELPGRIGAALAALPGILFTAFVAAFDFVTYQIGFQIGSIVAAFIALPGQIMGALNALWSAIQTAFTVAKDTMIVLTVGAVTAVVGFFLALPGQTAAALSTLWGAVSNAFTTAKDTAIRIAVETHDSVVSWFSALPGRAAGAVSSLWGAISGAFFSAKDQAIGQASSAVESTTGVLASLPGRAASALSGFAGSVAGALRSAVGQAVSIGGDIVQGLINGAQGAMGNLVAWARRAAGNVIQGFKDALKIGSPSKAMADQVGQWIPAGIAQGIDKGWSPVDATLTDRGAGLIDAARALATALARSGRLTAGPSLGGSAASAGPAAPTGIAPWPQAMPAAAATSARAAGNVVHLNFGPGSVVLDASKFRDFRQLADFLASFPTQARAMTAGAA